MAERTVEVGLPCPQCGGRGEVFYTWSKDGPDPCIHCDGTRTVMRQYPLAPDSLAALQIALAEAVMEWREYQRVPILMFDFEEAQRRDDALERAENAVRSHPSYQRKEPH